MNPLDLVSAHPWRKALFTTYSLSLAFFESVVLDALTRGKARQVTIVADVDGVRAALGEWGARGVGRTYQVEPVGVDGGIFHPKVTILAGDGEGHLLVGSGNLTFGGWGGNLEVLEHLHPSFASEAFGDAADMFEELATLPRVVHGVAEEFAGMAEELRGMQRPSGSSGAFRLLHGARGSIANEIAALASQVGGARRLTVAAPFFDAGAGLDDLCSKLGVAEVFVHAHPAGAVNAHHGANWPTAAKTHVRAVTVDVIDDPRLLHGKLFEVVCRTGRIVVSGSANVTSAALGPSRNVEAVVARIERARQVGWSLAKADVPSVVGPNDPNVDKDVDERVAILRGTLVGHCVEGLVLTKLIEGKVDVFLVEASGRMNVGTAVVDGHGLFRIEATALGKAAWASDRLVLALEDARGNRAEGFVLAQDYQEVTRRIGPIANRLFALLAGRETPADVAAIMSWFCENPARLKAKPAFAGGFGDDVDDHRDGDHPALVPLDELFVDLPDLPAAKPSSRRHGSGWSSFIHLIFAAFRKPRGPARPPEEPADEGDDGSTLPSQDRSVPQAFETFEMLLGKLLSNDYRHVMAAFDLALHLCDRLEPAAPMVKSWLKRIIAALLPQDVPDDRRQDVVAAISMLYAAGDSTSLRAARRRLLALGIELVGDAPDANGVKAFARALQVEGDLSPVWAGVMAARTLDEQRASYLAALAAGRPSDGYPDLPSLVSEWTVLEKAVVDVASRKRIKILQGASEACPTHAMALPLSERANLRSYGFGVALNCCGAILVREARHA